MRRLTCLCVLLIALLAGSVVFAGEDITVTIDGETVAFDVEPFIDEENRTQVPIRFISEEIGTDVSWEPETERVTIEEKERVIQLTIGEKRYTVDGQTMEIDTAPQIVNKRTMVPIRFVVDGLGQDVDWDGETRTVAITKERILKEDELLNASIVEMNDNKEEIEGIEVHLSKYYDTELHYEADQEDLHWAESKVRTGEDAYKDMLHITADGDDGISVARLVTAKEYPSFPPWLPDRQKLDPFEIDRDLLANFVFLNVDYSAGGNDHFDGSKLPTFPAMIVYDFFCSYSLTATPNAVFGWKGEISDEAKQAFAEEFYYWAIEEGYGVHQAALEAEFQLKNDYDLPKWEINYANGHSTDKDVFLIPSQEQAGAKVDYLSEEENVVTVPDPIEIEGTGSYECPKTGDVKALKEEDLYYYKLLLYDYDGNIVYQLDSDQIDLIPEDGYSDFVFEPIPTENLLGDHYEVKMKVACEEGFSSKTTTQVVALEDYKDLTVDVEDGGIVILDLLTHEVDVQDHIFIEERIGQGNEIQLAAHPQPGMTFAGWSGDEEGTEAVIDVIMDQDMEINAHFYKDIDDLHIEEGSQTLEAGDRFQFTALTNGEDVTGEAEWKSLDSSVAPVNDGYVHASGVGSTTIFASYEGEQASVSVTVEEAEWEMEVINSVTHPTSVRTIDLSPEDSMVAAARARLVEVWDTFTGELISEFEHDSVVYSVDFSSDGNKIVSGSRREGSEDTFFGETMVWDASSGEVMAEFIEDDVDSDVRSVVFSSDESMIVSGLWNNTVRVRDVETGELITEFREHRGSVESVAFSADDSMIVSGSHDNTARVWDAEAGDAITEFREHEASVQSVSFSSDDSMVVSGAYDNTVKVWDVETGKVITSFTEHTGEFKGVTSVDFSSEDSHVVSGAYDHTIKMWDVETGEVVTDFRNHDNYVTSVVFSSDDSFVVSGSGDTTVKVWTSGISQLPSQSIP